MANEDKLMTVTEVADYLQVAEKTVLRMIQKKDIPGVKIGSQWRFPREMIDDWILSRMQVVPKNDLAKLLSVDRDIVPLSRFVDRRHILMEIEPGTKREILSQLAAPLVRDGIIPDGPAFISVLLDRENLMSTAVGNVAFPHARNPRHNRTEMPRIVIGICREGTDFDAINGEKTRLFMLPVTDSEVVHLRLMAKMGSLLHDNTSVDSIVACLSPDEVIGRLISLEQNNPPYTEEKQ